MRMPEAVAVNEKAAPLLAWRETDRPAAPLGVRRRSPQRAETNVAVVGDVVRSLDATTAPEVYVPPQRRHLSLTIAVRTTGDPSAFVPMARRSRGADRDLPLAGVRTMDDAIAGRSRSATCCCSRRLPASRCCSRRSVSTACLPGQPADAGNRRAPAIGATPVQRRRLFVREGAALTLIGVVCGSPARRRDARARRRFGVTTTDPITAAVPAHSRSSRTGELSSAPARRAGRSDDGAEERLTDVSCRVVVVKRSRKKEVSRPQVFDTDVKINESLDLHIRGNSRRLFRTIELCGEVAACTRFASLIVRRD